MRTLRRYLYLFWVQLRTSLTTGMQYRWDFILEAVMGFAFAGLALVPLWVVSGTDRAVEGWSYAELTIVVGLFTLLKGILDGAVNPALMAVVEHIRMGTLDFILLKPADAQFLLSTARFEPWKMADVVAGLLVCAAGFRLLGRSPELGHVAVTIMLLFAACLVLYALWILVVSAAFWVVRLDNLVFLFMSLFDFGRWPVDIFKGVFRGLFTVLFTFVIPLAIMTTFPARALLGRMTLWPTVAVLLGSVAFAILARMVWLRAIGKYTSASS